MNNKILVCGFDVYESRDRRNSGQHFTVVGIDLRRNKIAVESKYMAANGRIKTHTTYVRPNRFTPSSNGYRLITRGNGITLYSSDGVVAASSSTPTAAVGTAL